MQNEAVLILDSEDIDNRLTRLAYQVYEQNFGEKEIAICGIQGKGFILAEKIAEKLSKISPLKVSLSKVIINKDAPKSSEIKLEPAIADMQMKSVVLCDDVLYTGKTMAYAAIPFLEANVKMLQCLVLIHRNHLTFPVQPRFTGLSLATTLQERVEVDFDSGKVWLKE